MFGLFRKFFDLESNTSTYFLAESTPSCINRLPSAR